MNSKQRRTAKRKYRYLVRIPRPVLFKDLAAISRWLWHNTEGEWGFAAKEELGRKYKFALESDAIMFGLMFAGK